MRKKYKRRIINYMKTNHVDFQIIRNNHKNIIAIDLGKIKDIHLKYVFKTFDKINGNRQYKTFRT